LGRRASDYTRVGMMYKLSVESHFDAAHSLRGYQGKCENIHGHRYKVMIRLSAGKLNDIGLAYDFTGLKKELNEVLARYDHQCLNEVAPFDKINPSAENIAKTVYEALEPVLRGVQFESVTVWESPDAAAEYSPSFRKL
jgi:6-pyruvoyltetrahydropterin/6-carboxytetrahydropterin synthase